MKNVSSSFFIYILDISDFFKLLNVILFVMQNLIEFIIKYKYWFVFFLMEGFCLVILFRFNNYQGSVFFTTANSMVGGIYSTVDGVTSYVGLGEVNEKLELENELLREEINDMKYELLSHKVDTIKYKGYNKSRYHLVGAQVINATVHHSRNLLTLDKGSVDGIKPEMGVICSSGVVGIVYLTSPNYAVVMPLINVNSKISCKLQKHKSFGTMEWKFGDSECAYMTGIPLHIKVARNEIVETNGFSYIFPDGIPVGNVVDVEPSADGLSQSVKVRLAVDYTTVRNVSIITNYNYAEKKLLENQADSLMNPD